jgi:type IV secretion system protein VirD4
MSAEDFFLSLTLLVSQTQAFFDRRDSLHTARFAALHELIPLLTTSLEEPSALLLAESSFHQLLRVAPALRRPELGNLLVVARTRGGKGLLATAELLTWKHSVVVNDIKGELFHRTAGYRQTLGKVYCLDPAGVGHAFDPLTGRLTEDKLYSSAKHLLFEPREGNGIAFTQRAAKMLTYLFLAARAENVRLLPYVRQLIDRGLRGAAQRLQTLSPHLSTGFLDQPLEKTRFEEDGYLLSSWGTLTSRLFPLLTENVLRCFSGSDFTPEELMCQDSPITVYLRWPEADLLSLSPLVRLIWESLIYDLITCYDQRLGKNCQPVLLLMDEAGRSAIPNLPEYASTVCGRGITLMVFIQALSQLDAIYGKARSDELRNNCESQLYYRPSSQDTAEYLERCLGKKSGFAHSESTHGKAQASEVSSEQAVPLLPAHTIKQLEDEEVILFHRNLAPIKARRMDWRRFSLLEQRARIPAPQLPALPALEANLSQVLEPETAGPLSLNSTLFQWGGRGSFTGRR